MKWFHYINSISPADLYHHMLTKDLVYRKAEISDIAHITQLMKLAYSDFANILTPTNWDKMSAGLSNENLFAELQSIATAFVCDLNNQLIGSIYLVPSGNPTGIFPSEWSYIRLLGVHPNYRSLGIGKKLTNLCIDRATVTGETTIALHTGDFMDSARGMYERLGFEKVRELQAMYDKKYWLYKRNL